MQGSNRTTRWRKTNAYSYKASHWVASGACGPCAARKEGWLLVRKRKEVIPRQMSGSGVGVGGCMILYTHAGGKTRTDFACDEQVARPRPHDPDALDPRLFNREIRHDRSGEYYLRSNV